MRQVIEEFLKNSKSKYKERRIESKKKEFKKKFNKIPEHIDIEKFNQEINEEFSFENWILNNSKTAYQVQLSTHPSKFSHPSIETSCINFKGAKQKDGYLKSGNCEYDFDLTGTSARQPLMDFLNLEYQGQKILNHFLDETEESKQVFDIKNIGYEKIREDFLSVIDTRKSRYTSKLVKQVYFYIGEKKYHNLSILMNSSIASQLNNKIKKIKFPKQTEELKKLRKNNLFSSQIIEDLLNLYLIKFGGTQPTNISNINKNNAGKFYLLPSLPPAIEKRDIKLPKHNFFSESINPSRFKPHFEQLEKLIQDERNNKKIRDSITNIVGTITDDVIKIIYKIRDFKIGWSEEENYKNLSKNQKILLDNFHQEERYNNDEFLDDFIDNLARWIFKCYEKFYPDTAKNFGDDELAGFKRRINISLTQDKEYFR